MKKSSKDFPQLTFKSCKVMWRNNLNVYVWPISDETKLKIREYLGKPELKFKFHSTLEIMPPFFCPECGVEITFFDTVREAVEGSAHGKEFIINALQRNSLQGSGVFHPVKCESGHHQPIVMGWPSTFDWVYDTEEETESDNDPAEDVENPDDENGGEKSVSL